MSTIVEEAVNQLRPVEDWMGSIDYRDGFAEVRPPAIVTAAIKTLGRMLDPTRELTDEDAIRVDVAKFVLSSERFMNPPTIRYKNE